jgi:hypothetical protein
MNKLYIDGQVALFNPLFTVHLKKSKKNPTLAGYCSFLILYWGPSCQAFKRAVNLMYAYLRITKLNKGKKLSIYTKSLINSLYLFKDPLGWLAKVE